MQQHQQQHLLLLQQQQQRRHENGTVLPQLKKRTRSDDINNADGGDTMSYGSNVAMKRQRLLYQYSSTIPRAIRMQQHMQVAQAADDLRSLVAHHRTLCLQQVGQTSDKVHYELEARLGHLVVGGSHFASGVNKAFMDDVLHMLERPNWKWDHVTNWVDSMDMMHRLPDGRTVRTTAIYVKPEGQEQPKFIPRTHVIKQRIATRDYRHVNFLAQQQQSSLSSSLTSATQATADSNDYSVRVCLSREEEVPIADIPEMIQPTFVRNKQRKSFMYRSKNTGHPMWRFDFTVCWEGKSIPMAEKAMHHMHGPNKPRWEIEVELVDPAARYAMEQDDAMIATSLMLKMKDMIGSNGCYALEPVVQYQ